MKQVFADAGYWIALLNPRDALHHQALAATPTGRDSILTSQMVLTEFLNFFAAFGPAFRERAAEVVSSVAASREVEIVPQSDEQFQLALALYRERPDKAWSLVDCASILLMRQRGLEAALAHDDHFRQAGFRVLLRG